jgi:hypothetical protein
VATIERLKIKDIALARKEFCLFEGWREDRQTILCSCRLLQESKIESMFWAEVSLPSVISKSERSPYIVVQTNPRKGQAEGHNRGLVIQSSVQSIQSFGFTENGKWLTLPPGWPVR